MSVNVIVLPYKMNINNSFKFGIQVRFQKNPDQKKRQNYMAFLRNSKICLGWYKQKTISFFFKQSIYSNRNFLKILQRLRFFRSQFVLIEIKLSIFQRLLQYTEIQAKMIFIFLWTQMEAIRNRNNNIYLLTYKRGALQGQT